MSACTHAHKRAHTHTHTYIHTHTCAVNWENFVLTFLDNHNNYFTLMMVVIGVPVKLSSRLEFDIILMVVMDRLQD